MQENKLDLFAVIELFGHTRMSGKVTEQSIGPATFIRVDVKETSTQPSFTRLLNPSAIYAINPVTEQVANEMAEMLQKKPIESWDINQMQAKLLQLKSGNNQEGELPY